MRFIETPIFTRALLDFCDDDHYRALQMALVQRPILGPIIPRSGSLRKVCWSLPGRGKSGSLRVIYFWEKASETFYMLYVYPKNEQENLTPSQLRVLARLVREEFA